MFLARSDSQAKLSALNSAHALIEFDLNGKVITANRIFLALLGYELDEIRGEHHSLFVDPAERETLERFRFGLSRLGGVHAALGG